MIFRACLATGVALTLTACVSIKTGGITAQGVAAAPAAAFAPSPDKIRAHMAFLADDALEGREAGTRGYDVAARYVASEFAQLGLKPAGGNGSYLQPVPLMGYRAVGDGEITLKGAGAPVKLVSAEDFYPGATPLQPDVRLSAPLVFAGYGLVAPERGRDDYAGLDVRGKIVVVLDGAPTAIQTEERAHYRSAALKRAEAAKRGAAGILLVSRPRNPGPTPPAAQPAPGPAPGASPVTPPRPAAAPARSWSVTWRGVDGRPAFDGAPTVPIGMITPRGAAKLFAGAPQSLDAVLTAAATPEGMVRGFALPLTATVALKTETMPMASANVAGMIEGSDPALRGEVVVLTAHLDHIGIRPAVNGDTIANGALDNASGVATMLEVARGFVEAPERPRRSMLFLAVTAEEKGLVGADYFAQNPTVPKASLAANVNLDMPILNYDFTNVVAFGAERSTIGPAVRRAAERVGITLQPDPLPQEGLFTRSDHYRFVEQGVPAVFLMTGFANGGEQAFTGFLAGCYHKVCDDLSQPINYGAAARFARVNYEIARELVDADERPRWNPGDFFGQLFAGPGAFGAPAAAGRSAP